MSCIAQYVELDENRNGMLDVKEMYAFAKGRYTEAFIDRVFQECQTFNGEMVRPIHPIDLYMMMVGLQELLGLCVGSERASASTVTGLHLSCAGYTAPRVPGCIHHQLLSQGHQAASGDED